MNRQFGMVLKRQKVFIYLIARCTDNFYWSVTLETFFYSSDRSKIRRTAYISSTVVAINHIQRTFRYISHQLFILRNIAVRISLHIIESMSHHDTASVNTLPQSNSKRIFLASIIKSMISPSKLLSGETYQSAMLGKCRNEIAETEAVRQKHICAFLSEFVAVETLS